MIFIWIDIRKVIFGEYVFNT